MSPWAAKSEKLLHVYKMWRSLPNDELCDKAYAFLSKPDCRDSALVCYNIVLNRYDNHELDDEETKYAADAMTNIGIMYMTFYYDYSKAYGYLSRAKKTAIKCNFDTLLPIIYIAMSNVMEIESRQFPDNDIINILRMAFQKSVECEMWDNVELSLSNLVDKCVEMDRVKDIRRELALAKRYAAKMDAGIRQTVLLKCKAAEAFARHDYLQAGHYFRQSSTIVNDTILGERKEINELLNAGECFWKARDFQLAEQTLKRALMLGQQYGTKEYLKFVYLKLSRMYGAMGDSVAKQYNEYMYLKCNDSLMDECHLASVGSAKFLDDLNDVNEKVRQLDERRRTLTFLLVFAAIVVAVICLLLYRLYQSYRRVQADHYHLYQNNVELLRREAAEKQRFEALQRQMDEAVAPMRNKHQTNEADKDNLTEIFNKVRDVMDSSQQIYQQDFTINTLADMLGLRYHFVSQAINEIYGHNFNALLNDYRIKEACRRFNDVEHFDNISIEGIAQSVGFKSRTGFSAIFKQLTGLSPSEYRKMAKAEQKNMAKRAENV